MSFLSTLFASVIVTLIYYRPSSASCSCDDDAFSDFLTINSETCMKPLTGGSQAKSITNYYKWMTTDMLDNITTSDGTPWYYWNPAQRDHYYVTESSYTAYLIISDDIVVLVDSSLGTVAPFYELLPEDSRVYPQIVELGCEDAIDYVVITHMHRDHNGWDVNYNNESEIVPTFPNAQYMIQESEYSYWTTVDGGLTKVNFETIFKPLINNSVITFVDGDYTLNDYISVEKCAGHTPGLQCVFIDDAVMIMSDVMHHPIQVQNPDWCPWMDINTTMSIKTRKQLIERAVSDDLIVVTAHFADPYYGKIVECDRCGGSSGYVWIYNWTVGTEIPTTTTEETDQCRMNIPTYLYCLILFIAFVLVFA